MEFSVGPPGEGFSVPRGVGMQTGLWPAPEGTLCSQNGFGIIVQDWGKGGSEEPH